MAENQPSQPGQVTFNYTLDQMRALYFLAEKPPTMSDVEWAIIIDPGFRQYVAKQLGVEYVSHQDLANRAR